MRLREILNEATIDNEDMIEFENGDKVSLWYIERRIAIMANMYAKKHKKEILKEVVKAVKPTLEKIKGIERGGWQTMAKHEIDRPLHLNEPVARFSVGLNIWWGDFECYIAFVFDGYDKKFRDIVKKIKDGKIESEEALDKQLDKMKRIDKHDFRRDKVSITSYYNDGSLNDSFSTKAVGFTPNNLNRIFVKFLKDSCGNLKRWIEL